MPDSPQSAKWLNDRERAIAVKRVAQAQLGLKNSKLLEELFYRTHRLTLKSRVQMGAGGRNVERSSCVVIDFADVLLPDHWLCYDELPRHCD